MRKSIDAESYTIHLSAHENGKNSEKECSYYMWRQKFPVKHENRVERRSEVEDWVITLAFPFGERLGRGNSSPGIYAFLPTEMVTNFPFTIQADFILSSSRETILLDDIWNQGILNSVPLAFVNAFTTLQSTYAKLNLVRESVRTRISAEEIVPSVSHLGQKFFHRPCEVGRLIPAFRVHFAEKARACRTFRLTKVSDEWYAKCIQGCDLVTSVSENTYVEVLLFIAENWKSSSAYGKKIEEYEKELKTAGVMSEFSQACEFAASHLMSLAKTSSLSRANVFSILKFIRHLKNKFLSPKDFIKAVKYHPDGAVLFSQDWRAASLISDIPFIDWDIYGEVNINGFKEELESLDVVVQFPDYSLIVSHSNPSKLNYPTKFLVLDCVRHLSPPKLINCTENISMLQDEKRLQIPC
ncbi:unnamed protein product [Arabis nemorensis]|uniref:Uncharacterized protein n=1 Tax=Arabis nemorensis TaxID=586526 RepID=A0A565BUF9_9BRAS|nr:unnamed protein product [Arabis nemorensis]